MIPYSLIFAAMLALLVGSGGLIPFGNRSARAAEVKCVEMVEDPESYPEDIAKRLWPSGFRPTVGMCNRAFLHGTIVKGDFDKVAALYRANHKILRNFSLLSPGGDAVEAMKIGRLFRRYLFHAAAPIFGVLLGKDTNLCTNREECLCASACALI